jgi:hypothetical protein
MSFWSYSRFRAFAFIASVALLASPLAHSQSAATLGGVLLDKDGAVIVGASVNLYSKQKTLQTKSDWMGRFEFRDLSPGTYKLEAKQFGFETTIIQPLHVKRGDAAMPPLSVTMEVAVMGRCGDLSSVSYEEREPAGVSLVGTLLPMPPKPEPNEDSHSPLVPYSQATIEVLKDGSDQVVTSAHPDAHGKFEFTGLAIGKYVLRAKYQGYYDEQSVKFQITREDVTEVTIWMMPQGEVTVCE